VHTIKDGTVLFTFACVEASISEMSQLIVDHPAINLRDKKIGVSLRKHLDGELFVKVGVMQDQQSTLRVIPSSARQHSWREN